MSDTHDGGCLCGAIRYRTRGAPLRTTICHCRFCQRGTGSAFLVEPIFHAKDVTFAGAEPRVYDTRSAGSGKRVSRHFCADCGTPLYLSFERFPGVVGLYGGTFDDPNAYERTPENTRHIFTRHALRDVVLPAGFQTYADHAIEADGTPNRPRVFAEPWPIAEGLAGQDGAPT